MFCCTLLYVHSSIAIILMGKREQVALLNLSSWLLVMVEWFFLSVPWGCLQFVIVVFPDHTHLLFLSLLSNYIIDIEMVEGGIWFLAYLSWLLSGTHTLLSGCLKTPSIICSRRHFQILTNKVSKVAKIRNRYNQVPHLTQDTNGKVTNSQKTPQTRAKRSALSQQVTTKHKAHINRRTQRHSKHKTEQKHKRSTKEVPPWNGQ